MRRLAGDGITLIGQLAGRLACGEDARAIDARAPAHSISAETTLGQDVADAAGLAHALWPLCDWLSARLKQASLATGRLNIGIAERAP